MGEGADLSPQFPQVGDTVRLCRIKPTIAKLSLPTDRSGNK